jgi:hypothetical protein
MNVTWSPIDRTALADEIQTVIIATAATLDLAPILTIASPPKFAYACR